VLAVVALTPVSNVVAAGPTPDAAHSASGDKKAPSGTGEEKADEDGPSQLVSPGQDLGYSLDDEWKVWWLRMSDRGGRDNPEGPLQQRFPNQQYVTHQVDLNSASYPLADEYSWSQQQNAARWWVHSYNATQLGTHVQGKMGRKISDNFEYRIRFDRNYTRDTRSDLVQGEFTYAPLGKNSPYVSLGFFPRIEKHDTDLNMTFGYRHEDYGDARLRIWGFDPGASGSYAVATGRGSPLDYLWKTTSAPLGFAAEWSSVRLGGLRTEFYAGGQIPQTRELYTDQLERMRRVRESSFLAGALLEWKFEQAPVWVGLSAMGVRSHFDWRDREYSEESYTKNEQTYQGRAYAFWVPRPDMRIEGYVRLTARPEQTYLASGEQTHREDDGLLTSLRWQWLLSKSLGFDFSHWFYDRTAKGPPKARVTGTGQRFVTRLLWKLDRLSATVGTGWNPSSDALYDGSGGTLRVDFD